MDKYECKRCKIFIREGQVDFCNKCVSENSADLLTIKKFMYETKHNEISTVSKMTGISVKTINLLLKSNQLILRNHD